MRSISIAVTVAILATSALSWNILSCESNCTRCTNTITNGPDTVNGDCITSDSSSFEIKCSSGDGGNVNGTTNSTTILSMIGWTDTDCSGTIYTNITLTEGCNAISNDVFFQASCSGNPGDAAAAISLMIAAVAIVATLLL